MVHGPRSRMGLERRGLECCQHTTPRIPGRRIACDWRQPEARTAPYIRRSPVGSSESGVGGLGLVQRHVRVRVHVIYDMHMHMRTHLRMGVRSDMLVRVPVSVCVCLCACACARMYMRCLCARACTYVYERTRVVRVRISPAARRRRAILPTPYCLLPTAYCLLPTSYCLPAAQRQRAVSTAARE